MISDLRAALRQLRHAPLFALTAVLTLALGIGAAVTMFTVMHAVLLRPLPYAQPDELVTVMDRHGAESAGDYLDYRAQAKSFVAIGAAESAARIYTGGDRAEVLNGLRLTDNLFGLLGVPALLGRTFDASDLAPDRPPVVVLSHALWHRRFAADPQIIGHKMVLDGVAHEVIGVMPEKFRFAPFWVTNAEFWIPLQPRAEDRVIHSLRVFARLRPGVTRESAQAEMDTIVARLAAQHPKTNQGHRVHVDGLLERSTGDVRPVLLVLAGAVALVLLIACANVASLLLVRAVGRQREFAVCAALGASRGRLLRRQLAESLWLVFGAAGGGVAIAYLGLGWITRELAARAGNFQLRLPRFNEISPDGAMLAGAIGIAALTTLACGLLPAWHATRVDLTGALRDGGRGATGGRRAARMRAALVVAEIALALMLLTGAGLLVRTFAHLRSIDPGFRAEGGLIFNLSLAARPDYRGDKREQLYAEIIRRLEALPGVEAASAVNHVPLAGDTWTFRAWIEGEPLPEPGREIPAVYRTSWPGYLRALGARVLAGRDFTAHDRAGAEPVILINETFARRHFPRGNALGARISLSSPTEKPLWCTIVGIVADVRQEAWAKEPQAEVYRPLLQERAWFDSSAGWMAGLSFVVRTSGEASNLAGTVRETVWGIDRNLPISNIQTLSQVAADAILLPRLQLELFALFAGVALLLAATGLYGVMAYSVAQRTTEIGVRLALGAQPDDILQLILRQAVVLGAIGSLCGLAGAAALGRGMTSLLHGVGALDPWVFAGATTVLLLAALLASALPAWRAARVAPVVALRGD